MTVFFCGPASMFFYKGVWFETQNTGCPIWPIRPGGDPYMRLSKRHKELLDELLAARKAGTLSDLISAQSQGEEHDGKGKPDSRSTLAH